MLREVAEFGVGTAVLDSELDGSYDVGVAGVELLLGRALDAGVRLEAELPPEEIKYSVVIGNYVFQDFQYERRIPGISFP